MVLHNRRPPADRHLRLRRPARLRLVPRVRSAHHKSMYIIRTTYHPNTLSSENLKRNEFAIAGQSEGPVVAPAHDEHPRWHPRTPRALRRRRVQRCPEVEIPSPWKIWLHTYNIHVYIFIVLVPYRRAWTRWPRSSWRTSSSPSARRPSHRRPSTVWWSWPSSSSASSAPALCSSSRRPARTCYR